MKVAFVKLGKPNQEILEKMLKWENDPSLVPYIRPIKTKEALGIQHTLEDVEKGLSKTNVSLIYVDDILVGNAGYQVDPPQLMIQEKGSAWISITIGEEKAQGIGIGTKAMEYLENVIREAGYRRIELGVFAFNTRAIWLYKKMRYVEIGRREKFTYWNEEMWDDIRMEKRI